MTSTEQTSVNSEFRAFYNVVTTYPGVAFPMIKKEMDQKCEKEEEIDSIYIFPTVGVFVKFPQTVRRVEVDADGKTKSTNEFEDVSYRFEAIAVAILHEEQIKEKYPYLYNADFMKLFKPIQESQSEEINKSDAFEYPIFIMAADAFTLNIICDAISSHVFNNMFAQVPKEQTKSVTSATTTSEPTIAEAVKELDITESVSPVKAAPQKKQPKIKKSKAQH